MEALEFGRDLGHPLGTPIGPANFDVAGASLDPAQFVQPLNTGGDPWAHGSGRRRAENPDSRQPSLRARHHRPRSRATKQRNEVTPLHSITSSARAWSVGG